MSGDIDDVKLNPSIQKICSNLIVIYMYKTAINIYNNEEII
jgi:hypothetical protein